MACRLAVLVLLLVLVGSAWAQTRPVLHLDFERGLDGVGPAGPMKPTVVGNPKLVPGKVGQGVQVGPGFGRLDFPTVGLLNRDAGTVEMWVCPVDWESADGKFHVFFECRGRGAFYLYEYWTTDSLLMLTCPETEGPYASSQVPTAFRPGEWHHIAGTWSPQGVQAYLDGKPAGTFPVSGSLPRELGAMLQIGDEPWQFPRTSSSLLDEVRIYDRALTPEHIAAHFRGDYAFTKPLTPVGTALTFDVDPLTGRVGATVDVGGADVPDQDLQARVGVVPEGETLPGNTPPVGFVAGLAQQTLALPSRDPGAYEVVAAVTARGGPAFEVRSELVVPRTEWLGNGLGLEDRVLPPWTPMEADGTNVNCWGRQYRFGGVLPTQVTTAGAEVLSRPIALNLRSGDQTAAWRDERARLMASSATRAELTTEGVATLGDAATRFRTTIQAEYDGFVLIELTCDSPADLPAEELSLEIPVKAQNALYRHRYASSWIPTSGNVPERTGVVDKSAWIPFAWLGDNDRGLFWCMESDQAWPNGKAENAFEIVRQGDEIVMRLKLLAKGQRLPADWKLVLGLQATPVKPIPKDWRKWRMSSALGGQQAMTRQNVHIVWPQANSEDSLAAFGYPEARNPERFAEQISKLHEQGLKAVPYLCLTYIREDIPEWQFHESLWAMGSVDPSIPDAGWKHTFAMVSPNGPGYADFIMAKTKAFLEQYGIDGAYHDQTHPYMSSAVAAGVGYERDGRAYTGTPILGYRALYRRDYAIIKSLPRETFTQAHMSGKVTIPVLAYDDSYLDGEHFREVVKDSYLDVMSLDSFRCEYMGRQWGLMPFFLPEFRAPWIDQVEPTRGMMALLLIHDTGVWPIWCNAKVVDEAYRAMDAFGFVDSEFLPYFGEQPPAATDLPDVYVSAYRRDDGQALLVIANLGREERTGAVRLDLKRLAVPATRVCTWPDQQPLTLTDNTLQVTVPGLGYRLVRVGK
jgi:hypothetical protein